MNGIMLNCAETQNKNKLSLMEVYVLLYTLGGWGCFEYS